jgi:hypothetical protein
VKKGWNLVGYPRESGAAPADELKSLGDTVVQIKNLTSSYDPSLPFFLNTLTTMVPGLGYWLKVTENGTWTVGDVSSDGANRSILKMASLWDSRWGSTVVYPNLSATVLAEVTVEGKAVTSGSVVAVHVGDELRGQQEVVLANGKSYATLNVNLAEAERVSYRIWEALSDREYGVRQQMQLENGETYGNAEALVKLDGIAIAGRPVLRSIRTSPFSFRFDTEPNRSYSIEGSVDLKAWEVLEQFKSTKRSHQFSDPRNTVFPHQYYRVTVE